MTTIFSLKTLVFGIFISNQASPATTKDVLLLRIVPRTNSNQESLLAQDSQRPSQFQNLPNKKSTKIYIIPFRLFNKNGEIEKINDDEKLSEENEFDSKAVLPVTTLINLNVPETTDVESDYNPSAGLPSTNNLNVLRTKNADLSSRPNKRISPRDILKIIAMNKTLNMLRANTLDELNDFMNEELLKKLGIVLKYREKIKPVTLPPLPKFNFTFS